MSKSKEVAQTIKDACQKYGWNFKVRGSILTITKNIESTNEAFSKADSEYGSILELLPTTSAGSVWGTDGGGVGAISAMNSGLFKMNKSGGSKRVLNALSKL